MSESGEVLQRCEKMLMETGSLNLGTLNEEGLPSLSYTPFIYREGAFYILISQLSEHTKHLQARSRASVMLIADESETRNIYARQRLTVQVKAGSLGRAVESESPEIITAMESKLGNTVSLLKTLADFELFELKPEGEVRYVEGFGRAYDLDFKTRSVNQVVPEK